MKLRFFLALLLLMLALGIQFFLAGSGIFVNAALASLIAFAFFFNLWELVVFILFAIFVINWQPAISAELVLFAVLPVVAYGLRNVFSWYPWAMDFIATLLSIVILYLIVAPGFILLAWGAFTADLVGSVVVGQAVFFILAHYYGT